MLKHLYIAKSPIHGRGVFASERLRRGMFLGTYAGPRARRDGTYVLWVPRGRGWVGISGRNKLRYLNHSSNPNAVLEESDLFALRSIEPHEEVTFDYGDEWLGSD